MDIGCEMRPVVPKFKRQKNIIDPVNKNKFIAMLKRELTPDFNLAITHDFYIDDCITFREGIKECGVNIPWLHWARSGVGHPIDFAMPNARYVYMNYADTGLFAKRIGVGSDRIRVVFNEKDPSIMFSWHPISKVVSDKLRLWEKDIIQTYPMCTTRMDAKGIDSVIRIFGLLKESGKKVALIICNANGRKRMSEIQAKIDFAKSKGLTEEDFLFTSRVTHPEYNVESEVPHKVVADLMQISNLFIFPTIAEVCSNVLLEASMTKNLLVLNKDLPSLMDFADENAVLQYPFTSLRSIHYNGRTGDELRVLVEQIIKRIDNNDADKQFRRVWRNHSIATVYEKMLKPILYEKI
jgi:glycosyltransferase involved in cell wall biosynthesis